MKRVTHATPCQAAAPGWASGLPSYGKRERLKFFTALSASSLPIVITCTSLPSCHITWLSAVAWFLQVCCPAWFTVAWLPSWCCDVVALNARAPSGVCKNSHSRCLGSWARTRLTVDSSWVKIFSKRLCASVPWRPSALWVRFWSVSRASAPPPVRERKESSILWDTVGSSISGLP